MTAERLNLPPAISLPTQRFPGGSG